MRRHLKLPLHTAVEGEAVHAEAGGASALQSCCAGWGSYPEDLQLAPVFQGCFQIARRFYALFQQHVSEMRVAELSDMFGNK